MGGSGGDGVDPRGRDPVAMDQSHRPTSSMRSVGLAQRGHLMDRAGRRNENLSRKRTVFHAVLHWGQRRCRASATDRSRSSLYSEPSFVGFKRLANLTKVSGE